MFGQVVTTHKLPAAHWAFVLLLASVSPFVTGQFVGASKLSPTILPLAHIRFLTYSLRKADKEPPMINYTKHIQT